METNHGMKRNTIKLVIRKKIDDWIETLPEGILRKHAREDTIVTGGCIASMLLGEKINDYDIYFRTFAASVDMAKHYCQRFTDEASAANGVSRSINPQVKIETKKNIKGEEEERILIWIQSAGVVAEDQEEYRYFESQAESTADSFVSSLKGVEELAEDIKNDKKKPKYRPVYLSQNAVTLSDRVQLVTRFYGEPEQIHKSFDYVHATCWYDYRKDKLVLPPEALEALLSRTLIYRGSLYPLASVFRIRKFIERGWRITAGQILKILWQVSELDLNDRELLNDQLIGVDQAYMWQLIQALKNQEGKVDATYIAKVIDEIFE